jgi:hypothetical protein
MSERVEAYPFKSRILQFKSNLIAIFLVYPTEVPRILGSKDHVAPFR